MTPEDFTVGARVRLTRRIGGNLAAMYTIEPGPIGTVFATDPLADNDLGEPYAKVLFDAPIADLEEWDNVLEITRDGEATADDFALIF